jgi:hypothetical protein
MDERLGESQCLFGSRGEKKNVRQLPGMETWVVRPLAQPLYRLSYKRRRDGNVYETDLTNFGFHSDILCQLWFSAYELCKNLCSCVAYYKRSKQFHADTHGTCSAWEPMKYNGWAALSLYVFMFRLRVFHLFSSSSTSRRMREEGETDVHQTWPKPTSTLYVTDRPGNFLLPLTFSVFLF